MFSEWAKGWSRTLRFRVMAWNVAVILLTALTLLLGIRAGVRFTLLREMDEILIDDLYELEFALADAEATAEQVREAVRERGGAANGAVRAALDEINRKARGHVSHGWFAIVRDDAGGLLWSSEGAPQPVPDLAEANDFEPYDQEGLRIVQSRRTTGPFSPLYVQAGVSTRFLQRDMAEIDELVLYTLLGVLLTTPVLGYWLAGRAIRPLGEMIHAMARYRPEKLHERLPQRGTGDELDQLARTVNGLLDRLASYLSQHRDFLANSAHELRTPLAAVRAAIEVTLDGARTKAESDDLLAEVLEECAALEVLVNQLLFLAETENERLRVRGADCNWSSLCARAASIFEAVAESRSVELRVAIEANVTIAGNAYHLRQVINNLLDNALKFTPPGGRVRLELRRDPEGLAVLRVTDSGKGIPPDDVPHVFERFFQVDRSRSTEGQPTGTGLGLSICQAVVESHGGTIEVASQLGVGTTFTVRLPTVDPDSSVDQARANRGAAERLGTPGASVITAPTGVNVTTGATAANPVDASNARGMTREDSPSPRDGGLPAPGLGVTTPDPSDAGPANAATRRDPSHSP